MTLFIAAFTTSRVSIRISKRHDWFVRGECDCLRTPAVTRSRESALKAIDDPSQLNSAPGVYAPIVNVPALVSFLIITTVFSFLILRINAVDRAAVRRKDALHLLRTVKSKELSSVGDDRPDPELVKQSLDGYERALVEEENLRTLFPGVRIVAPNGPASNSIEEVAAAKQFLGIDLQPPDESSSEPAERKGLPSGAIATLAVVALSQLALLVYMLSFDPMVATGDYTNFGGAAGGFSW